MSYNRFCRKHFTKIVIAVAVIYLISAVHFFGDGKESKSHHPDRTTPAPLVDPDSAADSAQSEEVVSKAEAAPEPEDTEKLKANAEIYQPIDLSVEHRKKRLQVLKEIYAIPHSTDDEYKLNESLSRTIDLDREPPELRPDKCRDFTYDLKQLPTVSVIFPIYNEALSMLLRAVHSVINNTPQELLVDVILVDDDSKNENLKEPLDRYIALLPSKVRVLRNEKREGLIRARMRGVAVAKGEVLWFQDVHTEFSKHSVEPILLYIKQHPNTIVQPVVEELQVNEITWPLLNDISHQDLWRGVFMWDMRYAWNLVPKKYTIWQRTEADPWPNPVLVGCSLAVGRQWFNQIGGFDEGLNIWGGENIEISLRTWMCGGRMVIHPCSRIAHVFKPFSYTFDGDKEQIIGKNSVRVVESWMDQHRDYFYASNYVYPYKKVELDEKEKASLRAHMALRERLKCKSFDWYLDQVLPEMNKPSKDMLFFGEIQNYKSKACWLTHDDGYIGTTVDCYTYSRLKDDQEFGITKSGQLRYFGKCVTLTEHLLVKAGTCGSSRQENGWSFEVDTSYGMQIGVIKYTFADGVVKCVQQVTNIVRDRKNEQMPQLIPCVKGDEWQLWYITYNLGYDLVPEKPV